MMQVLRVGIMKTASPMERSSSIDSEYAFVCTRRRRQPVLRCDGSGALADTRELMDTRAWEPDLAIPPTRRLGSAITLPLELFGTLLFMQELGGRALKFIRGVQYPSTRRESYSVLMRGGIVRRGAA